MAIFHQTIVEKSDGSLEYLFTHGLETKFIISFTKKIKMRDSHIMKNMNSTYNIYELNKK
ncbi:hypothetical protein RintRC_4191 [Richelia intracellularis]|nr:hypothetical protein RintRC_4191 [Richelia intracellularis]